MNNRLKEVRKALGLSQEVFAEKLDMKRNSIAQIETGVRNPSDRTLKSICREFNVNYFWLRDGEGDMFDLFGNDPLMQYAEENLLDQQDIRLIEIYTELPPEIKKLIKNYVFGKQQKR